MSLSKISDPKPDLIWLATVQIVFCTVASISPIIVFCVYYGLHHAQYYAGYDCTQYECHTVHGDARVAFFTGMLAFVTGGLLVATAFLFMATYGLYKAATDAIEHERDSAKTDREQALALFQAERRPWVRVTLEIISDMENFVDGHGEVTVRATATNVGLNPAMRVRLLCAPPILDIDELNFQDFGERIERSRTNMMEFGVTLFPEEPYSQDWEVHVPNILSGNAGRPAIAAWASYKFDPNDPSAHVTPYVCELQWRLPNDSIATVPRGEMRLRPLIVQIPAD